MSGSEVSFLKINVVGGGVGQQLRHVPVGDDPASSALLAWAHPVGDASAMNFCDLGHRRGSAKKLDDGVSRFHG